jgi:hypothetical protein
MFTSLQAQITSVQRKIESFQVVSISQKETQSSSEEIFDAPEHHSKPASMEQQVAPLEARPEPTETVSEHSFDGMASQPAFEQAAVNSLVTSPKMTPATVPGQAPRNSVFTETKQSPALVASHV